MSGYPNNPYSSYYGPPPPSHAPPPYSSPYSPSAPPYTNPSGPYQPQQPSYSNPTKPPKDPSKPPKDPSKPPKDHHNSSASSAYGSGYGPAYGSGYGAAQSGYGASAPYGSSPFAMLVPSVFPPGTDPNVIACFQVADQDGSGLIDDKELQGALSSYGQGFSMRTVHLLMYNFTNTNARKIGPKEFASLFYSLQNWRSIFERFDRDRSGKIDPSELREALLSLGYAVSPTVLELLVSKFDKTGGKSKAIEYDNFIECCLTVKGLTEKFKAKDTHYSGSVTFAYEEFMLTVLPFLIA